MKIHLLALAFFTLLLGACEDSSSVSSGGGNLEGDGGTGSAQFAGTYRGQAAFQYSGAGLDGVSDLQAISIIINRNGTVSMTIEETTVGGVINNNKVEISLRLQREQDGVSCDATVGLKGTVVGRRLSGPISGSGKCKVLGVPRDIGLSGSFAATKT